MDRRRLLRLGLIAAVVIAAVGAATFVNSRINPSTADVTGVVVAVDSGGTLGDVRGFTLLVAGGELLTFSLRALDNPTQFPPGHLAEHQATAVPVRVVYRIEGSERLATHLEDAPR